MPGFASCLVALVLRTDSAREFYPSDFSGARQRKIVHKVDKIGNLVVRERRRAPIYDFLTGDNGALVGNDARADGLSQNIIRNSSHHGLPHRRV